MKKLLTLLVAAVMTVACCLGLTACGAKDKAVALICLHGDDSSYDKNFIDAFKAACEAKGLSKEQYTIVTGVPEEGDDCYNKAAGFADAGAVVQPYRLEEQSLLGGCTVSKTLDGIPYGPYSSLYDPAIAVRERLHASTGAGFFFSMNRNFITAVEFGRPLNPQDGTLGVYVNLGFSF